MSGTIQFEPKENSIKYGKTILALSFIIPYLVQYSDPSNFDRLMIYAPTWVFGKWENNFFGGPTPMAIFMFLYWLPYSLIGFQSYRYAKGLCSSMKTYLLSILILTLIAILLALPLSLTPTGMINGVPVSTPYFPIPVIPIIALLSVHLLAPVRIDTPWDAQSEQESQEDKAESIWNY